MKRIKVILLMMLFKIVDERAVKTIDYRIERGRYILKEKIKLRLQTIKYRE